jgi:hypothetical protein
LTPRIKELFSSLLEDNGFNPVLPSNQLSAGYEHALGLDMHETIPDVVRFLYSLKQNQEAQR